MKKFISILIFPFIVSAQLNFIPVSADYASFYSTDSTAYLEVYLSIFQGNLSYTKYDNENYVASFTTNLELSDADLIIENLSHSYQNATQDTSSLRRYNQFVDIFSVEIPYGEYRAKLQMVDNTTKLKGEYILDIKTIKPSDSLFLSDIELCSHVSRDTTRNIFYKNQLQVVPNPRRVFDMLQPMLYYYVEINKLSYEPDQKNLYEFDYFITTAEGDTVKTRPVVTKEIIGNTLVEVGALNVMALPQNTYFITTRVTDLATQVTSTSRRNFYVYKPSQKDLVASESKLPEIAEVYIGFSKDNLVNEFQMVRYIARRDEERIFKNLENAEAMKKFLTDFWLTRDKEINAVFGASRLNYMQRVDYANANFGSMGKAGWKSDRGRILLLYGEPDEQERFPSSMDILPYIIWRYHNLEGSQHFIFSDLDGFGEYRLIHSTYRKELQNPDWQRLIQKGGTSF
jgi:GWxTD domain-containing protein